MKASRKESRTYYTYTNGFYARAQANVTRHSIVRLIEEMHREFGPGYTFVPEPISEGGVQMVHWPNISATAKSEGHYKTFRFQWNGDGEEKWPWIEDPATVVTRWSAAPDVPIWASVEPRRGICVDRKPQLRRFGIFLKAFHGAPCWTLSEVKSLANAFQRAGFRVVVSSLPKGEKKLHKFGDAGLPRVITPTTEPSPVPPQLTSPPPPPQKGKI